MRLLLDECLPKDLAGEIPGHAAMTVQQAGWASIKNGKLLRLIAASGKFDVFVTVDKNLPREQKIGGLRSLWLCCAHNQIAFPMSFHLCRN